MAARPAERLRVSRCMSAAATARREQAQQSRRHAAAVQSEKRSDRNTSCRRRSFPCFRTEPNGPERRGRSGFGGTCPRASRPAPRVFRYAVRRSTVVRAADVGRRNVSDRRRGGRLVVGREISRWADAAFTGWPPPPESSDH